MTYRSSLDPGEIVEFSRPGSIEIEMGIFIEQVYDRPTVYRVLTKGGAVNVGANAVYSWFENAFDPYESK